MQSINVLLLLLILVQLINKIKGYITTINKSKLVYTNNYCSSTNSKNIKKSISNSLSSSSLLSTLSSLDNDYNTNTNNNNNNDQRQQLNTFVRLKKSTNTTTNNNSNSYYELQTCAIILEDRVTKQKIELQGVVHFGTNDYFTSFHNKNQNNHYDSILYELIIPQSFLAISPSTEHNMNKRLNTEITSSDTDTRTALQLGLVCQANVMDYTQTNWYCADVTKEELESITENSKESYASSSTNTIPGGELLTAFFQPVSPRHGIPTTRLFSKFFLPGEKSFASFLRYLLWFLAPAPDLSVLLLDYSLLLPRPSGVSPIAGSVFTHLFLNGNIQAARQLIFSNILVSSHRRTPPSESLIIRNDHALRVLYHHLDNDKEGRREKNIALIYGVHHCPDIINKLLKDKDRQFVITNRSWRTAFTIPTSTTSSSTNNNTPLLTLVVGAVLTIGYLIVSAFDWFSLVQSFAFLLERQVDIFEISFDVIAYVLRHLIVYLTLVKFLIQWDDRSYSER